MSAVHFDLSKLIEKHGTEAVLHALRDACLACGDHSQNETWSQAGHAIDRAAFDVARAMRLTDVTIGMALDVIDDGTDPEDA